MIDNFAAACWNTAQQLTDILYTYNVSDGSGREAFVPCVTLPPPSYLSDSLWPDSAQVRGAI